MPDIVTNSAREDKSGGSTASPLAELDTADEASRLLEALYVRTRQNSPELVAASISTAILRREVAVGQRLIEADLTARYKVSRSTVREALKLLATEGVVQNIPNRGAVIRSLTWHDVSNLLQVLGVLIGLAARMAAQNIERSEHRDLFMAVAALLIDEPANRSLEQMLVDRSNFYQVVLLIADNEDLSRSVPTSRTFLFRNQFHVFLGKENMRAIVGEYQKIQQAICAGDPDKAEAHTRRHLRNTADRILPFLE